MSNPKNNKEAGVYDPGIFKAVFLAGGPGSGKSFVARQTTVGHGIKLINSDLMFEHLMKTQDLDLNMKGLNEEQVRIKDEIRERAKQKTDLKLNLHLEGRLGIVIDGTGRNFDRINGIRTRLVRLGYDTVMIFVNTSLDVAKSRNTRRSRVLPDELVEKYWRSVQENIGKFQRLFGSENFIIIDNNVKEVLSLADLWKWVMKFVKRPIESPIAKEWIRNELALKRGINPSIAARFNGNHYK